MLDYMLILCRQANPNAKSIFLLHSVNIYMYFKKI